MNFETLVKVPHQKLVWISDWCTNIATILEAGSMRIFKICVRQQLQLLDTIM